MAVEFKVRADTRGLGKLNTGLKETTASTKAATVAQNRMRRSTKGLAAAVGALRNQVLLVTFALAGVVAGAKKLSNENQALVESMNAVNVVFQSSAASILLFGTTASQQLGIARSEFNQLSTVLGALLKQTGIPLQQVAGLTLKLTERATDLASVFDTEVKSALNAINSALRGQTEPLTRYASDVTIAALENFALSEGIIQSVSAMTQQEKRLLRVRLILKQTADVQGDFLNTQEGTANLTRKTISAWKDMIALLGGRLDPVVNATIGVFNNLFVSLGKTIGGTKLLEERTRLLRNAFDKLKGAALLGDLLTRFVQLNKDIESFKDKIEEAARITQEEWLAGLKEIREVQTMLVANEKKLVFFENLKVEAIEVRSAKIKRLSDAEMTLLLARLGITEEEFELNGELLELMGNRALLEQASNAVITKRLESVKEITEEEKRLHVATLDAEDAAERFKNETRGAARAANVFSQNLARALISGQDLEKALLGAAINFGLSKIPGGSLFGGLFAHGGVAPGGFVPSIVGEGGGAPEIVQSASPIRVTPITSPITNNNNRQNISVVLNLPNVGKIDKFELRNVIIPLITEEIERGTSELTATRLRS